MTVKRPEFPRIDVDFNDLARGGKVRVQRSLLQNLQVGDFALLRDAFEQIELLGYLAAVDHRFGYFSITQ